MDQKCLVQSYREDVNQCRFKLAQLEVDSVEHRAYDDIHQWRLNFNKSVCSKQVDQVLHEIEEKKRAEVSRLTDDLRYALTNFKQSLLSRLAELDAFIMSIDDDDKDDCGDDLQWDYVKFELSSINKQIDSLHMDITVQIVDISKRKGSSTPLAHNSLQLVKVFDFKKPGHSSYSFSSLSESIRTLVRRASSSGATQYKADSVEKQAHF